MAFFIFQLWSSSLNSSSRRNFPTLTVLKDFSANKETDSCADFAFKKEPTHLWTIWCTPTYHTHTEPLLRKTLVFISENSQSRVTKPSYLKQLSIDLMYEWTIMKRRTPSLGAACPCFTREANTLQTLQVWQARAMSHFLYNYTLFIFQTLDTFTLMSECLACHMLCLTLKSVHHFRKIMCQHIHSIYNIRVLMSMLPRWTETCLMKGIEEELPCQASKFRTEVIEILRWTFGIKVVL